MRQEGLRALVALLYARPVKDEEFGLYMNRCNLRLESHPMVSLSATILSSEDHYMDA